MSVVRGRRGRLTWSCPDKSRGRGKYRNRARDRNTVVVVGSEKGPWTWEIPWSWFVGWGKDVIVGGNWRDSCPDKAVSVVRDRRKAVFVNVDVVRESEKDRDRASNRHEAWGISNRREATGNRRESERIVMGKTAMIQQRIKAKGWRMKTERTWSWLGGGTPSWAWTIVFRSSSSSRSNGSRRSSVQKPALSMSKGQRFKDGFGTSKGEAYFRP